MPAWGELLSELQGLLKSGIPAPLDVLRRKYLVQLQNYTHNNVILYATRWTPPLPGLPPEFVLITEEDIQGLMEVIRGLSPGSLDLIIHSPGGSAEATEAMVSYIRSKFSHVRVFVPHAAMSAATMLACSANRIVMGKHSFLGPVDPQIVLNTPLGAMSIPAQAILDQFETAKQECQDPKNLAAWLPMLSQYGPALLVQCREALDLSKELVSEWLTKYMFAGDSEAPRKVQKIANALADHKTFKTHGRHIGREQARSFGLTIDDLEVDQKLQDLVLSIYHATSHTFNGTGAVKIIENHLGRAYVKSVPVVPVPPKAPTQQPPPQGTVQGAATAIALTSLQGVGSIFTV